MRMRTKTRKEREAGEAAQLKSSRGLETGEMRMTKEEGRSAL
jgi:hypothetical protein